MNNKKNFPAEKAWEKDADRLWMHWTGSTADKIAAQEIIVDMCSSAFINDSAILNAGLIEDARCEMVLEMFKKLERFDPSRVSDHDKDGNDTSNRLKKYLLSEKGHALSDACAKIYKEYNLEKRKEVKTNDLGAPAAEDDNKGENKEDKIPDPKSRPEDEVIDSMETLNTLSSVLAAIIGVVEDFRKSENIIHQFGPICFSEHLAYVILNDDNGTLRNRRIFDSNRKSIQNSLDWDYLRYFIDDPLPSRSLYELYGTQLRTKASLFPDCKDVRLRFNGEKKGTKKESSKNIDPAQMSFFLDYQRVPHTYYNMKYHKNRASDIVGEQRAIYVRNIMKVISRL